MTRWTWLCFLGIFLGINLDARAMADLRFLKIVPAEWDNGLLNKYFAQQDDEAEVKTEVETEFNTVIVPLASEQKDASDRQTPVVEDYFGLGLDKVTIEQVRDPHENKVYLGPRVPVKGRAISLRTYERTHAHEDKERAQERIEQAKTYRAAGEGKVSSEILSDIIRQYHFSKEAALAAILLAEYSEETHPLIAISYYVYVVNLHIYSGYEEAAFFHLGVLLNKEHHYVKSEELLLYLIKLIDERKKKNPAYVSVWYERAENYLVQHYQSFIRWGQRVGDKSMVQKYRKKETKLLLTKGNFRLEQQNPQLPVNSERSN